MPGWPCTPVALPWAGWGRGSQRGLGVRKQSWLSAEHSVSPCLQGELVLYWRGLSAAGVSWRKKALLPAWVSQEPGAWLQTCGQSCLGMQGEWAQVPGALSPSPVPGTAGHCLLWIVPFLPGHGRAEARAPLQGRPGVAALSGLSIAVVVEI